MTVTKDCNKGQLKLFGERFLLLQDNRQWQHSMNRNEFYFQNMKAHRIIEIMEEKDILGHLFHSGGCGSFVPAL